MVQRQVEPSWLFYGVVWEMNLSEAMISWRTFSPNGNDRLEEKNEKLIQFVHDR